MQRIILILILFIVPFTLNAQTSDTASGGEQGMYFAKKAYTKIPLPTFQQIKPELPQPVYDENPLWGETYWKAWELAFAHFYEPAEGSGFVSPVFDAAFNDNIFLWDGSFITMFANYASPMVNGIDGLDNFYCKQYPSGEICREIGRTTGIDYKQWRNEEDRSLFSRWGFFHVPEQRGSATIQYIGRSVPSPNPKNTLDAMNHPILAWAEWESYKITGNTKRLGLVWEPLVKYYAALQKYIRQGNGLYMTDWASMDNSSRNVWLNGGGMGIDISSEMVLFARNLADIAAVLGKEEMQRFYTKEADELSAIINKKMWNDESKFYFDLNLKEEQCSIKTVAGFWTLIAQVASPQQAEALSQHLQNPDTFGRKYPVPTLAADEKAYSSSGQYWCGAVWAPTNTMVIHGLEKYGYDNLAYSIALKHIEEVAEVYKQTGTIWENYSADSASHGFFNGHPIRKDFVGWSGIGPISYLLEYAIGLKPYAANNTLVWNIRSSKPVGCRNYRFNGHTVHLAAKENVIEIDSDGEFTLSVQTSQRTVEKKIVKGHQSIEMP